MAGDTPEAEAASGSERAISPSLSDSESDSDSESAEEGIEVEQNAKLLLPGPKTRKFRHSRAEFFLYQHSRIGTLHLATNEGGKAKCGRMMSGAYALICGETDFDWPCCQLCYADVGDPDALSSEEGAIQGRAAAVK
jgi:hypothetical protein